MKDRRDIVWVLVVSILILVLSSIPTWTGYRAQTPTLRFRGTFFDSQDYSAHIAMMEAGAHGQWTYQFRFTTEPMHSAYVRIFYIALGHVSYWIGLDAERTFELARWLLGFAALASLYWLMSRIFENRFWIWIAFLLASLGSGLGWLQLILGGTSTQITPVDFWFIDGYVFFGLALFPHYAFVTAGFCLTLGLWLDFLKKPATGNIIWIIVITVLVQFANPIAFATVDAAFMGAALFIWWNDRKINTNHLVGLTALALSQTPILVYNMLAFSHDPLWSQYTSQHQTLSPPPDYYLWGFAPLILFALYGMACGFREKSSYLGACILWIVAAFILSYSPLYTQRRFLLDLTIPLAILATEGWIRLLETRRREGLGRLAVGKTLAILFVFFASLSSIQLSLGRAVYVQTHPADLFYPAPLDAAALWLRSNAAYNDIVLASGPTSQVLAQKAGVRVYSGHEMETLNYETKQASVEAFYQGDLPELASPPVKWVISGPQEKALGPGFGPLPTLQLVYEAPQLKIFKVK